MCTLVQAPQPPDGRQSSAGILAPLVQGLALSAARAGPVSSEQEPTRIWLVLPAGRLWLTATPGMEAGVTTAPLEAGAGAGAEGVWDAPEAADELLLRVGVAQYPTSVPVSGAVWEAVHSKGSVHMGWEVASRQRAPSWPSRNVPLAMTCCMEVLKLLSEQGAVVLRP